MTSPVDEYVSWLLAKRRVPRETATKYQRILTAYLAHVGEPEHAKPEDVEQFTTERPRRGDVVPSDATVANEVAILSGFYRWAMARYAWPTNPAALAGRPRVHNRKPRPLRDHQWCQLWGADLPDEARAALGLGFFCGLRRAEIVGLRTSQVGFGALVNFKRKGGGEDRMDYADLVEHWRAFMPALGAEHFPPALARVIANRPDERLMPWASGRPQALNKRFGRWLTLAGYEPDEFTPHQLRHSFVTNLLRSGVSLDMASDLADHHDPGVTMHYIDTAGGRLAHMRQAIIPNTERTA